MNRLVNAFVIFQFLKTLVKPFKDTDAYKLGIIDDKGNYLKKQKDLKTPEEKRASNIFLLVSFGISKKY